MERNENELKQNQSQFEVAPALWIHLLIRRTPKQTVNAPFKQSVFANDMKNSLDVLQVIVTVNWSQDKVTSIFKFTTAMFRNATVECSFLALL